MPELEEMSKSDLWNEVKILRDQGVDIGDLKYGSPKEDLIAFIKEQETEPEAVEEAEEEEEEYKEISDIEDVPDDEPEEEVPEAEEVEEEESEEEAEEEVPEEEEDDYSEFNDEIEPEEEEEPEEEIEEVEEPEEVVILEEPVNIPAPAKKARLTRLISDADLRSYIGKPVEFKASWFRGTTECLVCGSFVVRKFQKSVLFKGNLPVLVYKWIKTKRIKIERW